jgi:hypothetical protein
MKKLIVITALTAAAVLLVAQPKTAQPMGNKPVVVELFTSQGCSSCPPADQLLSELAHDPALRGKIIPLAFHVDYWDHLGWRDPFSSRQWTARQMTYVRSMSLASAYTPQIVVDGQQQMVGSDRAAVLAAIGRASHDNAGAKLAISNGVATGSTSRELELIALQVQSDAPTAVKAGENDGRTLHNESIVRELTRVARVNGAFSQAVKGANVVLLQDPKTLKIYAAARR